MEQRVEFEYLLKAVSLLASHYGSMFCSILFTFWLARLLDPADFGRLAIGVFSLDIFNALTDWGWDQAILHENNAELSVVYSTHFFIRFILGSIPLLVVVGMFFLNTALFSSSIHWIAFFLAIAFWVEKISLTYKTILEKEYKLHHLAWLEIGALITSFVCAIISVYLGFGPFALVVQRVFEKIILLLGYVLVSSWKYGTAVDVNLIKKWIHSFGIATLCGGLVGLFLYDFMATFIGLTKGTTQGGLYARSFKMATLPLIFTAVCGRLTTPLYAKHVGNLAEIKKTFLTAQFLKLCIILPVQLMLVFGAFWWIPILLGKQWEGAVFLYQLLSLYGFFRSFYDDVPAVFMYGLRQPWILFQQHLVQGFTLFFSTIILRFFVEGAILGALVMGIGMIIGVVVLWMRVFSALQVTLADIKSSLSALMIFVREIKQKIVERRVV